MSDEKPRQGVEKMYLEESTGLVHSACCPETKRAFGDKNASGECPKKELIKELHALARDMVPFTHDTGGSPQSGPAQVATPAYRENWDTIFGTKKPVGQA